MTEILRLSAFAAAPGGGNPAGVVLDAGGLSDTLMQQIAAEVGYAESAFVTSAVPASGVRRVSVRYFSPIAEVPFCGHATVAAAVALSQLHGPGSFVFETMVGDVLLEAAQGQEGIEVSFTSVDPVVELLPEADLDAILNLLQLLRSDLADHYPPRLAFAGNPHPVLVLADAASFDSFSFDPEAMRGLMDRRGWTGTVTLLRSLSAHEFEARNLFPVGDLVEDPATGSAAASVGAYLRELQLIDVPAEIVIRQGRHIGRPSVLRVQVPVAGGITVSGGAIRIED